MKKSRNYDKAVKNAYNLLVSYRRYMDDKDPQFAAEIEDAYKQLWRECINERAPWLSQK